MASIRLSGINLPSAKGIPYAPSHIVLTPPTVQEVNWVSLQVPLSMKPCFILKNDSQRANTDFALESVGSITTARGSIAVYFNLALSRPIRTHSACSDESVENNLSHIGFAASEVYPAISLTSPEPVQAITLFSPRNFVFPVHVSTSRPGSRGVTSN